MRREEELPVQVWITTTSTPEGPDYSFIEIAANVLYDLIKTSIRAERRNQAENG